MLNPYFQTNFVNALAVIIRNALKEEYAAHIDELYTRIEKLETILYQPTKERH